MAVSPSYLVLEREASLSVLLSAPLSFPWRTVLRLEVSEYGRQMKAVASGTAPSSCYTSAEVKERLYLATHYYQYKAVMPVQFSPPSHWPVGLYLVHEGKVLASSSDTPPTLGEQDLHFIKNATPSFDRDFFEAKYDGENYSLGYDLLPMTKRLVPDD